MIFNYVTTNSLKFAIAERYFASVGSNHELVQLSLDTPEIQDSSVETIARESAIWAARKTGKPCIKLDAGFFINALNGFPGPFVKYVNDWFTQEDYLRLLDGKPNRSAYFTDATAVGFPDGTSKVFTKNIHGSIATEVNPHETKWPANLLFIPDGHDTPLGSLTADEQSTFWGDGNWPQLIEYCTSITS